MAVHRGRLGWAAVKRFLRLERVLYAVRRQVLVCASVVVVASAVVAPVAEPADLPAPSVEAKQEFAGALSTPTPTPVPLVRPERIVLPALDVDAPIVPVGTEEGGAMGTPGNGEDVAWWHGAEAGEGNALFAGHRDWKGARGSFYDLKDLEPGDEVHVVGDGEELTFTVEWVRQVDADTPEAPDILTQTDEPVITLITCGGVFDRSIRHYTDRVVARAVLA